MAGRGGKGGGLGDAAGSGMSSMIRSATKRIRDLDISDAEPPVKKSRAGIPDAPPLPATRGNVRAALDADQARKQAASAARRAQKDAKANNPAGSKASGVSGGSKPTRLWSTPQDERPRTIDTLGPGSGPGGRVEPSRADRQTVYWAARWLPTSKNPKGLGGGKVPTDVGGQAAWVAYQRADRVLYPRQTFPADVRAQTWEASAPGRTTFVDVGGTTVHRDGTWDMGHVPGHEHWSNVRDAFFDGRSPGDFKDDYLDPANYRPEHPSTNRTHKHEAD